jgi:hypothetical protein
MTRIVNLPALKTTSANQVSEAMARYESAEELHYVMQRWVARMTAVELHAIWERYAERRLVTALNHAPEHFIVENNVKGVKRISAGLAFYLVRNGGRYFDFRSIGELLSKGDALLGKDGNPFRQLSQHDRHYIDALASIRNCVVHGSEAATAAYKRSLKTVYAIQSAPGPDEFLNAKDFRASSPMRYASRLHGLAMVVSHGIQNT